MHRHHIESSLKDRFLLPEQAHENTIYFARPDMAADIQTVELCLLNFLPCKDASWDEPIGNKLKIFSQDIGAKEILQV